MKTLALELSSAVGSIAWLDGPVEWAQEWPNDRRDSGAFFRVLADVQKAFGAPEKIVVGLGPGSYAGTRIAISTAIGLSQGGTNQVRLVGYPSLCAIPCEEEEYCVVGDARRQSFFFARIAARSLVEAPILLSESELASKIASEPEGRPIFTTESLPRFERAKLQHPCARLLAELSEDASRVFSVPPLEPMYLRDPYITLPRTSPRLLASERKRE